MTAFDLLVVKGTLVTPRETVAADVGVIGEKIAAISAPGALGREAAQVLDVAGQFVLPGIIDGHVHFREPGLEYKEDFGTGTRAAVMGGVTTVLEMPNTAPTTSTAELVKQKRELAEAKAYCDFGLYGLLAQDSIEHLQPMADAGVIGFKCFLGRSTGEITPPDDGRLLDGLKIAAARGLRVAFHAENDQILQHAIARLKSAGRRDPLAHAESRPIVAEVESIQRAALFALETGADIHILHLSSRDGLSTIEEWRRKGVDITCEVAPHHCFLTTEDFRRLGAIARINPPLREPGHGDGLLAGLASGAVTMVATDHSPHLMSEKRQENIWDAVSGFVGVETSLRLFLTHAVQPGRLSLSQLVRAMSEGPARTWGLYPRKGAVEVGSDADVVVVDLTREDVIESRRLHSKNNPTPFEGWRTRGAAVATIVRGALVMHAGDIVAPPHGRMLTPGIAARWQ